MIPFYASWGLCYYFLILTGFGSHQNHLQQTSKWVRVSFLGLGYGGADDCSVALFGGTSWCLHARGEGSLLCWASGLSWAVLLVWTFVTVGWWALLVCGLFPHFLLIQDFVVGLNENLGWASRVIPCRSKRGKCDSVRSFYRMVELLITAFFPKPADMTRLDSIFKAAAFELSTHGQIFASKFVCNKSWHHKFFAENNRMSSMMLHCFLAPSVPIQAYPLGCAQLHFQKLGRQIWLEQTFKWLFQGGSIPWKLTKSPWKSKV